MRIMVIGDFHGKFPRKFEKIIKKEKIDLVVSLGDYPPFHYRKLWFKHCYGKDVELLEVIGRKRYKELVMKDLRMAENVLKRLNQLSVPVFTVLGNIDWPSVDDVSDLDRKRNKSMPNFDEKTILAKRMKKYENIKRFDYKALKFKDYIFIGMRGHSNKGHVKSKSFKKHRKILDNLFNKFKKQNKERKVIFVSHNVAYNTKLDRLSSKTLKFIWKSLGKDKKKIEEKDRHYGSKLARRIINTHQPVLSFGGHIHESWGKDKIGKTIAVNPGAAHEGRAAIIELSENKEGKGKVKSVKFAK